MIPDWLAKLSFIDWVQVASAVAGAVAALAAFVTIRQSAKNSRENQEALIRERRIDYELDVLTEILSEMAHMRSAGDRPKIALLARTLPTELVPITRAVFELDSTPQARLTIENTGWERRNFFPISLLDALRDEVAGAVTSRLAERNTPATTSRWRRRR